MLIGIACLAVFVVMAMLMYSRRISALLALPVMAIVMSILAGISEKEILSDVINQGATKMYSAYTTTMFGAVLADLMNKHGIAKALIRWVAEFSGDNQFVLGMVMTLATALLFSTLGGLGAVIMVGTIVLPALLSLSISSVTAGALFLFGISLGGMFNIASWQLYISVLNLEPASIIGFVVPFAAIIALIVVMFLVVELKNWNNLKYLALAVAVEFFAFPLLSQKTESQASTAAPPAELVGTTIVSVVFVALLIMAIFRQVRKAEKISGLALLTPITPLILVLVCHWDFIPAFLAGITYGVLTTWKRDSITVLTRSIIDGISSVIPAVVLMIGIGMLITAVRNPVIASAIEPVVKQVVPTTAISYVIIFTLAAPLALYRGPLSLWGMGSGLVALIQKSTSLGSNAIMGMLMSVGQIQGICDPTNTHNIWIATYLGTDTQTLLKKTAPYAWLATIAGLCLAVAFKFVPFG
ncbi:MAG: transporter [Candidatus Melainabacteria bacterium]|nr:transporter [Candidatus Melainabacteria bacterium]